MKRTILPCPYCEAPILIGLLAFSPAPGGPVNNWRGAEVFCPSCRKFSTFPARARWSATGLAMAAAFTEVLVCKYLGVYASDSVTILLAALAIQLTTFLLVSALVVRHYGQLVGVDHPTQF